MIAFDTNILTAVLQGNAPFAARAAVIPAQQQAVPVIVLEELLRGRLNIIRQAEAKKAKISLEIAYELLRETFVQTRRLQILPFTSAAESFCRLWQQQSIRVSTHDLRIAAICMAHKATLVTRNRRDFERIPGLLVEFWQ